MKAHRALSQQYQDELKKLMFERDEALKYKNLNVELLEELRLLKERLNRAELESSAWEARYHNEFADHENTRKTLKPKTKRKAK